MNRCPRCKKKLAGGAGCGRCGWGAAATYAALPNAVTALNIAIHRAGARGKLVKELRMLRDDAIAGTTTARQAAKRAAAIEQEYGFTFDLYGRLSEIGRSSP